ncbi:hypothetical protein LA080_002632 [Diaporthe eres]|nr:hypothetical protein LA080_002632 [Diaporthe eres]
MASSISFDQFPNEVWFLIFEELYRTCRLDHRRTTAYASVGRVWQMFFEAKHFERLQVTVSLVSRFGKIVNENRRQLVKHIWLDVQFDPPMDPCRSEICDWDDQDKTFAYAVGKLFGSLSKWEKGPRQLTLEISTSRRSTSNLSTYHRLLVEERRNREALPHVSHPTSLAELPQVDAVTELQFRRNDYFVPTSDAFHHLLGSLPAVKKIEYEQRGMLGRPWAPHVRPELTCALICENLPTAVTELVIFTEVLDSLHPLHQLWSQPAISNVLGIQRPSVGLCSAKASRQLQHLSVSFAIDAQDFFLPFWPQPLTTSTEVAQEWVWSSLETLALTSQLLRDPGQPESDINRLLEAASFAVRRMPRLHTLELWNGNGNDHACIFRYSYDPTSRRPSLFWRGTWPIRITRRTANCWRQTVLQMTGFEAEIQLETSNIRAPVMAEFVAMSLNLWDRVATNREIA